MEHIDSMDNTIDDLDKHERKIDIGNLIRLFQEYEE